MLLLAACWGPSFLFIKFGSADFPPFIFVTLRVGFASLLMFLILFLKRVEMIKYFKHWKAFAIIGFFANALPFFLITVGELTLTTSLAALITATVPIFVACGARFISTEAKIPELTRFGVMMGLVGASIVFFPTLFGQSQHLTQGCLLILGASLSYAVGILYTKKVALDLPPLVFPAYQLMFATLYTLPFSLIIEQKAELPHPTMKGWLSLAALSLFGTFFAFILYHRLINRAGAVYFSYVTLLFPIVGIFLGVLILHESLSWYHLLGALFIFGGLFVNRGQKGGKSKGVPQKGI